MAIAVVFNRKPAVSAGYCIIVEKASSGWRPVFNLTVHLCGFYKVQNGDGDLGSVFYLVGGCYVLDRLQRCLLSDSSPSLIQTLPDLF